MGIKTIYVNLLNEGVSVARPVQAVEIAPNVYKILKPDNYDPDDEEWEFTPGTIVKCQETEMEDGMVLLAKTKLF